MKLAPVLALVCLAAGCDGSAPSSFMPPATGGGGGEDGAVAGPDLGSPAPLSHCNATDPRSVAPEVFATPEAGEQPYVDVLQSATKSIRVEIYLMGYGGILTALEAKAKSGVSVRVMLDKSEASANQKYFDELTQNGVQVQWSDPQFTYMHAKFFVVDEREAVISTGNYSLKYSIALERNFVARDSDPDDVANLVTLFDADWNRAAPTIDCTRLLISPINARARILDLIRSAQKTLIIESMQLADFDVRTAIRERKEAGVDVRALLADAGWITANADAASWLKSLGIPVKHIPHLHTKMLVVDGASAYLGSENFSSTSLNHNREVGLIVIDASSVQPLVDTFTKDWAVATDF